ncbi:MAG: squalene/phytoene synthase family protein [Anaerolineaceae bacterium]|nr:squalene/phytoene synthase family protein [Anaerolineaceae bacterium]
MSTPVSLAASITRESSRQSYYTIRLLADHGRVEDAFRAYAYFRWVDDCLDLGTSSKSERRNFLRRQKSLLDTCYRREMFGGVCPEEQLLVDMVGGDLEQNSGLRVYLYNLMAVMDFDAGRRGRLISQVELDRYSRQLACAVTEALHHFIGHDSYSPHDETRYLAVEAAHITHMLRDTIEDARMGYFNVPGDVLRANRITPADTDQAAYRTWVKSRVELARRYFRTGRDYIRRVPNLRCRLAGYAYVNRFEWLLDTIEKEDYLLRPSYEECKSATRGFEMGWQILGSMLGMKRDGRLPKTATTMATVQRS